MKQYLIFLFFSFFVFAVKGQNFSNIDTIPENDNVDYEFLVGRNNKARKIKSSQLRKSFEAQFKNTIVPNVRDTNYIPSTGSAWRNGNIYKLNGTPYLYYFSPQGTRIDLTVQTVDTSNLVDNLPLFGQNVATIIVKDPKRGGIFHLKPTGGYTIDNGIVFQSNKVGYVWVRAFEGFAHPRWYGAKGDNVTNDISALRSCLINNLYVDFENLQYVISDTLSVRSGHILKGNEATIRQTGTQKPIFSGYLKKKFTIEGLTLIGKGTDYLNYSSLTAVGVKAFFCDSFQIKNVFFINNAQAGIWAFKCSDFSLNDNNIQSITNIVPNTDGAASGIVVEMCNRFYVFKNKIRYGAQGIVVGNFSSDGKLYENDIKSIFGQHGIYADAALKNIYIYNNVIDTIALIGIKVQNYDDAPAPNGPGDNTDNIEIRNNTISNCGGDGIAVVKTTNLWRWNNRNVRIQNNTIKLVGQEAVSVNFCIDCIVSDNTGKNIQRTGLQSMYNKNTVFLNNNVDTVGENGLLSINDTLVLLKDNNILNCGINNYAVNEFGIKVEGGRSNQIVGNKAISKITGKMRYGFLFNASADSTFVVKNNQTSGYWENAVRFITKPNKIDGYENNDFADGINEPTNGYLFSEFAIPSGTVINSGNTYSQSTTLLGARNYMSFLVTPVGNLPSGCNCYAKYQADNLVSVNCTTTAPTSTISTNVILKIKAIR